MLIRDVVSATTGEVPVGVSSMTAWMHCGTFDLRAVATIKHRQAELENPPQGRYAPRNPGHFKLSQLEKIARTRGVFFRPFNASV